MQQEITNTYSMEWGNDPAPRFSERGQAEHHSIGSSPEDPPEKAAGRGHDFSKCSLLNILKNFPMCTLCVPLWGWGWNPGCFTSELQCPLLSHFRDSG